MAWDNAVVTNAGVAMYQQVLGGAKLIIDYASGGSGTVAPVSLMAQTALKNQKQVLPIVGLANETNGKKVNILIVSEGLTTGYTMNQIGIWAHVGSNPPALYAILQDNTGIAIPSNSEIPDFALNFYAVIDASNEAEFTLIVNTSALVSVGMMNTALTAKLDNNGNGSDLTAAFLPAETRTDLSSGEKLSVLFGKVMKWFADLGASAFKNVGTGANDVAAGDHVHSSATTSTSGFMSSTDKSKLDGIAAGAQVNTVNSVAGKTGVVTLNKSDVELSNVNNTSDADKPVSTAQQNALSLKVDLSNYTAADVLDKIKTVDGSGSGLDADLLDGKEASAFATAAQGVKADELDTLVKNGVSLSPTLSWGMNNKVQIPEVSSPVTLDFEGFSITNLLGNDGNCEDVSKYTVIGVNTTKAIDSTGSVFGSSSIKATATAASGYFGLYSKKIAIDPNKYYFFSAYCKMSGAINFTLGAYDMALSGHGDTVIASASAFTRIGVVLHAELVGLTEIYIRLTAATNAIGNTFNIDGVMINEIPAEDASLPLAELMAKYPYVDNHACLMNPMFENRRHNLVINGNCEDGMLYWTSNIPNTYIGVVNGKFRIDNGASPGNMIQMVPVKKNTNYYISANLTTISSEVTVSIYASNLFTPIRLNTPGTFNTGDNESIGVVLQLRTAGAADVDSIMLIEGTTAPTAYKSCDLQRFVVEGRFEREDKIHIENKEVSGTRLSKYRVLYGKDYDWQFISAPSGYKTFTIPTGALPDIFTTTSEKRNVLAKHNGDIVPRLDTIGASDNGWALNATYLYLNMPNTESGFIDSISPTGDEVKAIMNGWKTLNTDQSRYTLFVAMGRSASSDLSLTQYPPNSATTVSVAYTNGQTTLTVADGSIFKTGDYIAIVGFAMAFQITGVSGNVLTVPSTTSSAPINAVVARCDNGTTDLRNLNYCKANIAPGYTGHKFTYYINYVKPEPISDVNTHIHGEIWDLVKGDNHIRIEPGIVLGEVANPIFRIDGYFIGYNHNGAAYPDLLPSAFKYPATMEFIQIRQNGIVDPKWGVTAYTAIGNFGYASTGSANINPGATYTADYKILKTMHVQSFGSLSLSYRQSIINSLNGLSRAVEEKQPRDSFFDQMLDASIYEVAAFGWVNAYWVHNGPYGLVISFVVPCNTKRVSVYAVTVLNMTFLCGSTSSVYDCTNAMKFEAPNASKTHVILHYSVTDSTVIANIKNYGLQVAGRILLDCRGRI
ncbi:MAG: hypothetical protein K0R50_384 [Eubacterium sp.]|jgi:hypothetical protein|nr:hypothetical protein [Eubacterium sp.]